MTTRPACSFDLLELWVHDAERAARHFQALGFAPRDPLIDDRTGEKHIWLVGGAVAVLLRQAPDEASEIARHVATHGDTVADVGLVTERPDVVAERALAHGLQVSWPLGAPRIDITGDGTLCHTIRDRSAIESRPRPESGGLAEVDHIALCLPYGLAEPVATTYQAVFGLDRIDLSGGEDVGDTQQGMRSIPLGSARGDLTVVLTEPMSEESVGQTKRFIDEHAGPGVQHAAIRCDDLASTVELCRSRGVEFLPVPDEYYVRARQRLGDHELPWEALQRLRILADVEAGGLLLQLFTRPLADRGTFFFELIERSGATGFGANNVRALFDAVQAAMLADESRSVTAGESV